MVNGLEQTVCGRLYYALGAIPGGWHDLSIIDNHDPVIFEGDGAIDRVESVLRFAIFLLHLRRDPSMASGAFVSAVKKS